MKILFPKMIFYPSQVGGRSQSVYWLTKALYKTKKIIPIVITTNKHIAREEVKIDKFIKNEIGIVFYSCDNHKFPKRMLFKSLSVVKKVDLVHLSSLFFKPSLLIALYARILNKKIIWSVHGELESSALSFNRVYKKSYLYLLKLVYNKNIVFHSTSNSETRNIKTYFPNSKIVQLPNYMELPIKINVPIKKQFLFIGRINPIKALDNLLFGLYSSKKFINSEFELVIAGLEDFKGYKNKLIDIIKECGLKTKIKFLGSVQGKEKEKLFAESYFLFLPSHSENFGNVVIESLAQSTPVVASYGTPWQILEDRKAGYWIDNSPEILGNMVDKIIDMKESDYNKMRIESFQLVDSEFNINNKINNWINVYESLKKDEK